MRIIYDSPRITITHRPGNTGNLVISFAGVGLSLDGLPQEEFVRTLSGNQHDQFFVIDKLRSWYNATATEISDQLTCRIGEFDKVYTLGNSMGGFGAIYFGRQLPKCSAAVAFGAQYSVHPEIVPGETRWMEWREKITAWPLPHALSGQGTLHHAHLFYGQPSRDAIHADLYLTSRSPGMALYMIAGAKHRSASFLKERGCLTDILDLVFVQNADAGAVAAFIGQQNIGVRFHDPATRD